MMMEQSKKKIEQVIAMNGERIKKKKIKPDKHLRGGMMKCQSCQKMKLLKN